MTLLDVREARRRFERAASTCTEVSVLGREVERRMAERLDCIKLEPARVLDIGCGVGEGLRLMRRRYPRAALLGVDAAVTMLGQARRGRTLAERAMSRLVGPGTHHVCADMRQLPLVDACAGMIWSNLALGWAQDSLSVLREFHRLLEVGGLVMFSTYGPDTLTELRQAFARADGHEHVHRFPDMHDLGDLLLQAGFAEPVMDMEYLTLTYTDVTALVRDIRLSGQSNVLRRRHRGLLGRHTWQAMLAAYERNRSDGRLPATIEIVYGHAWKPRLLRAVPGDGPVKIDFLPAASARRQREIGNS